MTEDEAYIMIGKISTKFSNLEFGISSILEHLINQQTPVIGAILTKSLSLSKITQYLKRLIPFIFTDKSENGKELFDILSEIETIRIKRNLFIHGNWFFQEEELKNNLVTCLDTRLKSRDKGLNLHRMEKFEFSKQELIDTELRLADLVYRTFSLAKRLGSPNTSVENK